MIDELKVFAIKLAGLLVIGPIIGFAMLKFSDLVEEARKTNNRKKKWLVMCIIFGAFAGYIGWLR